MYEYAKLSEVKQITMWCENIIHDVQNYLKDHFTFDIKLNGSGEKRLVMKNGKNDYFDLDYNLILQKDKKNLISNPQKIRQLFIDAFNHSAQVYGFDYANDSTSVITVQLIYCNQLNFSFDVAILVQDNDGKYYSIKYDKISNRYLWNEIKHSKNYMDKFRYIKENGQWMGFKERYKYLKNMHLSRNDKVKSFSIFLETLNEF